jgi:hypothetical protein
MLSKEAGEIIVLRLFHLFKAYQYAVKCLESNKMKLNFR